MEPEQKPNLLQALTLDSLEEVAAHCSVQTLLSLHQTCTTFAQLLARSEKVWVRKLAEDYGLHLKASPSHDAVFIKLARTVYEARRTDWLRFQGTLVTGGVDEDAMQYWVDNLFKNDKAPYCSNCSFNADCLALLLDGEVPRDVEYERVRGYMVRRCRYAAALIMNVQLPAQDRDPDAVMNILEDWSDAQLESFFRDLVAALHQGHALGRLLVYDVEHARIPVEQQRIHAVERYLRDRLKSMKQAMLKPPLRPNTLLDTTVLEKIADPARTAMAGVVQEVTLSRQGNLTCPVSTGVVFLGHIDYSLLRALPAERVLEELEAATQDPVCTAFNFLSTPDQVEAAAAAGRIPPIAVTDQTLAGIWHEFELHEAGPAAAGQLPAAAGAVPPGWQQQAQGSAAGAANAAAALQQPVAAGSGPAAEGEAPGPPGQAPGAAAAAQPAPAAGPRRRRQQALHPPFAVDAAPADWTPLHGRLVRWRPLLWFHFNSYAECQQFVRSHHSLLAATAPRYNSITVRHRGPPSTEPGTLHLPTVRAQEAARAERLAAQQAQQAQQPAAQPGPPGVPPPRQPIPDQWQQQQEQIQAQLARQQQLAQQQGEAGPLGFAAGPGPSAVYEAAGPSTHQAAGPSPFHTAPPAYAGAGPSYHGADPALAHAAGPSAAAAAAHWQAQQLAQQQAAAHAAGPSAAAAAQWHVQHHAAPQAAGGFLQPAPVQLAAPAAGPAPAPVPAAGPADPQPSGSDAFMGYDSSEQEDSSLLEGALAGGSASSSGSEAGDLDDEDILGAGPDAGFGGMAGGMAVAGAGPMGAMGPAPGAAGHAPAVALPVVGELEDEMDEAGSEGGSDDEEQHAQHVAGFYQAVAAVGALAAAGDAALGVPDPLAQPSLGVVSRRSTRGRNKLSVRLSRPVAGNAVLVKLVSQEDMMHLFHDQHDWPNIDMSHVGLSGKTVRLPPGVSLAR